MAPARLCFPAIAFLFAACTEVPSESDLLQEDNPSLYCGAHSFSDDAANRSWKKHSVVFPKAILRDLRTLGFNEHQLASDCTQARRQFELVERNYQRLESLEEALNSSLPPLEFSALEAVPDIEHRVLNGEKSNYLNNAVVRIQFWLEHPDKKNNEWLENCTGTIISPNHVLTAAHCVGKSGVQLARVSTARDEKVGKARSVVVDVVVHPKYKGIFQNKGPYQKTYDLALVRFADTKKSLPEARLHQNRMRISVGPISKGLELKVRGTGMRNDAGSISPKHGTIDQPPSDASFTVDRTNNLIITAQASKRLRTCKGDSGGPAFRIDGLDGLPRLAGVFHGFSSLATFCPREGARLYWSRLKRTHRWIKTAIESDKGLNIECKRFHRQGHKYMRCWK